MSEITRPLVTSTSLSILLHGAAFAVLLLVYGQATTTGHGLDIELVSSVLISPQQATDEPRRKEDSPLLENVSASQHTENSRQKQEKQQRLSSRQVVASRTSTADLPENDREVNEQSLRQQETAQVMSQQIAAAGESRSLLKQATNAAQQQHSLLELLHDSISDNKEYPYIARRQRREGVTTVSFILHPDGNIDDAHVVTSSRTTVLDRAALTAVKRIAPFRPAQEYLDHAEEFSIDVVFNLL